MIIYLDGCDFHRSAVPYNQREADAVNLFVLTNIIVQMGYIACLRAENGRPRRPLFYSIVT